MDCNTKYKRMKEMFIMYANHKKFSHERKIPANPEKDVCVYFKVKNELGMCECWCESKPNKEREMYLPCDSKWKNLCFFVWNIFNFARGTSISSSLILNILIGWLQNIEVT